MKKLGVIALALVLLAPMLPVMAIGVLMNPAAKGTCLTGALTTGPIPDHLDTQDSDGHNVTLNHQQLVNASTIISVGGRTSGVNRDGVIIALMAALTESSLRNLANTSNVPESADYPHDGDGTDHDSLGLFQMRPSAGWGQVEDLMDTTYQAKAFYGGGSGPNHGNPPGLLDHKDWQTMSKVDAAQAVEVSGHPERYALWQPVAQAVVDALTAGTITDQTNPDLPDTSTVVFPLPDGTWTLTSHYGPRIHPITHQQSFHSGTDYAAPDGTPILAVADGVVTFAGAMSGYGHAIDIRSSVDGQQVTSRYGHMWAGHLYVTAGNRVVAGQHIADVGSDGNSTGPHLHFEIHVGGATTDSDQWLTDHGANNLTDPAATASGCYTQGAN